ncbi:DM13 domain-containing protein [Terracidiphilus gabretensis]|jgi:Electron transfer DM13|uniref:DM13 domain-containing protein n=1 Tax=Terracidiphilus gabretensis TaxID=1577687 RepID=UPI00071C1C1F|nr:DM13 domain-containing protein [Terracidiphilus gabretensis]
MLVFLVRHRVVMAIAILATAMGFWYLFRPEKLFTTQRVNEAAPFAADDAARPAFTGLLRSSLHETKGRATVYRAENGTMSLRLTDFSTSNGPDVHVVLVAASDPGLKNNLPGQALQAIEVDTLKGNEGNQEYRLPENVDLTRYDTVAIYCERFRAVFGTAKLEAF